MKATKEKGCPVKSSLLPKSVLCTDDYSDIASPADLQALHLMRRFSFSVPVAAMFAGLAYGEVAQ